MKYEIEFGELTDKRKRKIHSVITNGNEHGYYLRNIKHRYFLVEKFYKIDFKKNLSRAPMGLCIFNLTQILEIEHLPENHDIAELLMSKA